MLLTPGTDRVAYPPTVERSLEAFAWVGLDIDGFGLPLACLGLGTYHQKLLFMMLLPLALVAVAKLIGFARRDRSREKRLKESGQRVSVRRKLSVALAESSMKALPMALRVTFLAFPAISSLAFKAFQCDDLDANDGGVRAGVMAADFSVRCWDAEGAFTPEYARVRTLAVVAIICYPVAMPCVYALLFWNVRHDVWSDEPTKLAASIEFLSGEYSQTFYFWELTVVIQKFLLVGLLSIDLPGAPVGSLNQLIIAYIIVLCFLVALMSAKPYRRRRR